MFLFTYLYIYILHIYFLYYLFGGFNIRYKNKFLYLFYGQASGRYLVKPHAVFLIPSIQSVKILLKSLLTLQYISTPMHPGIMCELTEGSLIPLIQIIGQRC